MLGRKVHRLRWPVWLALPALLFLAGALGACSDDDDPAPAPAAATYTVTINSISDVANSQDVTVNFTVVASNTSAHTVQYTFWGHRDSAPTDVTNGHTRDISVGGTTTHSQTVIPRDAADNVPRYAGSAYIRLVADSGATTANSAAFTLNLRTSCVAGSTSLGTAYTIGGDAVSGTAYGTSRFFRVAGDGNAHTATLDSTTTSSNKPTLYFYDNTCTQLGTAQVGSNNSQALVSMPSGSTQTYFFEIYSQYDQYTFEAL
jgi:hypothetical protein